MIEKAYGDRIKKNIKNTNVLNEILQGELKEKKYIAITGVTGFLGRNLFFEYLKKNLNNLDSISFILFGRNDASFSLYQRVEKILLEDGQFYLNLSSNVVPETIKKILGICIFVNFELIQQKLNISISDLQLLQEKHISEFYHLASCTDWRSTPSAIKKLDEINIEGVKKILDLISILNVDKLIYSSSAYVAGITEGRILPDYDSDKIIFRNYYEKTKLEGERLIKKFANEKSGCKVYIFRLTGIGGRLLELPEGAVSKYDIFLGWAQFFLKLKHNSLKTFNNIYEQKINFPIRIAANRMAGMNVVAVDYAAKMMISVPELNQTGGSFHLVNDIDISHEVYIKLILDMIGINGWSLVDKIPAEKTPLESLFYRAIGSMYSPYITTNEIVYDQSNLTEIKKLTAIENPKMTIEAFQTLLEFAKKNFFGLVEKIPYQVTLVTSNKKIIKEKFSPPEYAYKKTFKAFLSDTTQYGNVYYTNFDQWVAKTKEEYFLEKCPDLTSLYVEQGIKSLIVIESNLKLKKEVKLHENVSVYMICGKPKKVSPELFYFLVDDDGELIGEAFNRVIFMDRHGKPIPAPKSIYDALMKIHADQLLRVI